MNASLAALIKKLESGELNFATIEILSNFVIEPAFKVLAAEFRRRSKEDAEKIVARNSEAAPRFENAEQNTNYLRMNAQCEPRKCDWESGALVSST